jgi:single-strand DNA-binding protein
MVNKVFLIGNLGKDPELTFTTSGKAVCKFSVATAEKWTDGSGEKKERTDWHNIVVWGKQAEACGQYLTKGRQAYVEGSIQTRNYEDKSGVKRYVTEIVARDVRFLGGNQKNASRDTERTEAESSAPGDGTEEDTPF